MKFFSWSRKTTRVQQQANARLAAHTEANARLVVGRLLSFAPLHVYSEIRNGLRSQIQRLKPCLAIMAALNLPTWFRCKWRKNQQPPRRTDIEIATRRFEIPPHPLGDHLHDTATRLQSGSLRGLLTRRDEGPDQHRAALGLATQTLQHRVERLRRGVREIRTLSKSCSSRRKGLPTAVQAISLSLLSCACRPPSGTNLLSCACCLSPLAKADWSRFALRGFRISSPLSRSQHSRPSSTISVR